MATKPQLGRSLYIGLGGTGANALRQLKKRYLEVYGHVDLKNHELPEFVKFLVFDTDRDAQLTSDNKVTAYNPIAAGNGKGKAMSVNFNPAEVIGVHAENCKNAIQNVTNKKMFEGWFPLGNDEIIKKLGDLKKGASQIRLFGRVAFFFNADRIQKVIRDAINEIMAVDQANSFFDPVNNDLNIYIVGSLAGGTGSGMFMDTAMMCRHIITSGSNSIGAKIRGYFVLPEVFMNARIATDKEFPRIYPNAAGALKELDLFMEFLDPGQYKQKSDGGSYTLKEQIWDPRFSPINEDSEKEEITIRYLGGEAVTLRERPFDAVYLVGQSNTAGNTINSLNDISVYLAKSLFSLSGAAATDINSGDNNTFDDKIKNDDNELFNGKIPWVGGIGVSEIVYNSYEVRKHLALRAIDQSLTFALSDEVEIAEIGKNVQRFLEDSKLIEEGDNQHLVKMLMSETTPITIELNEEEYAVPENKLNDKRAYLKGQFEKMAALAQKLKSESLEKIKHLKTALPEKGTLKAEIRVVEEIQIRLQSNIEELRKDQEVDALRAEELNKQRDACQNEIKDFLSMNAVMRYLKKSALMESVNTWSELCRNLLEIDQFQEARRLALDLCSSLTNLLDTEKIKEENEFRWLTRISEDVRKEISNREYGSIASKYPNAFTINQHSDEMQQPLNIFSENAWNQDHFINDLQDKCAKSVKEGTSVEDLWKNLNGQLVDDVCGLALSSIVNIKEDKLEQLLKEGIEESKKHGTASESILGQTLSKLLAKSLPLINYSNSSTFFNGKNESLKQSLRTKFYIFIPTKDEKDKGLNKSIKDLLNKLHSDDDTLEFKVLPAPDQMDRITVFRRLLALPVYELSGIRMYLKDYDLTHTQDLRSGMVYHTNYNWFKAMKQIGYNLLEGSSESSHNKLKSFVWCLLMGWIKWEGEFWKVTSNVLTENTFKLRRDQLFKELMMEGSYNKEVDEFMKKKMSSVAELKNAFFANVAKTDLTYDFSGYLGNKAINPYAASITSTNIFGSSYDSVQGGPTARNQLAAELEILKELAKEVESL
ncbi:MAG: hypothetical protein EBX50_04180 [Chitinophagia bacterium]|nr:hypothetical protein [Chitinophagia bacterium]